MIPTAIVAYLALFATVGFLFVLASLLLGKVLRSHSPTPQKTETYECGEPAVGPGSVQFDLRFYVVALVFLIFEVEMAFFFPPATVFGQATRLLAAETAGATHGADGAPTSRESRATRRAPDETAAHERRFVAHAGHRLDGRFGDLLWRAVGGICLCLESWRLGLGSCGQSSDDGGRARSLG